MHRAMTIVLSLLLFAGILTQVTAQEAGEEAFVQTLFRHLERLNWEESETGALEKYLFTYEWKNLTGVDAEILAQSLSYGKERGIAAEGELVDMAYELSLNLKAMRGLSLQPREMLRASLNAVRAAVERFGQEKAELADFRQQFKEQIKRQVAGIQESSFRNQSERRQLKPGRSGTWSPPVPEERTGSVGGSGSDPPGPAGSGSDSVGGNGGR